MTTTTPATGRSLSGSFGKLSQSISGAIPQIMPTVLPPLVCTSVMLLLWQLLCSGAEPRLPAPTTVITETWDLIKSPFADESSLGTLLFQSLVRVGIGYLFSVVIGVGAGLLLGASAFFRKGFDPLVQVLRTVPPIAWLPISLALFKDANTSAFFVIFITAVWPILINTAVGVQQVPQDYNNVAKVLRLSKREYVMSILFPSTVPYVFTGLRIGIGLAWLAIVAAEMMTNQGIGFRIWDAYNAGNVSTVILGILFVGLTGLVLDRIVGFIGSKVSSDH
jgi:nitrate/nitrite transport system permease protein